MCSVIPHHTSDLTCDLCELKLNQAHIILAAWFRTIKVKYPDVHISWSYRNEDEQRQCVENGKSKLFYPNSAHNKTGPDGEPRSLALDLFQLNDAGEALWEKTYFAKIAGDPATAGAGIRWGGRWTSFGDSDHFELTLL